MPKLKKLSLHVKYLTAEFIETCFHHIDVGGIEDLDISCDAATNRALRTLLSQDGLRKLRRLTLYCTFLESSDVIDYDTHTPLIQCSQRLTHLDLYTGGLQTYDVWVLLRGAGKQLRSIRIPMRTIHYEKAITLSQTFHNLEALSIGITRCQGDENEWEIYSVLSQMPQLRKLELQLHPKAETTLDRYFINLAVDRTLVEEIASTFDQSRIESLTINYDPILPSSSYLLKDSVNDIELRCYFRTSSLFLRIDGHLCLVDHLRNPDFANPPPELSTAFQAAACRVWDFQDGKSWPSRWCSFPLFSERCDVLATSECERRLPKRLRATWSPLKGERPKSYVWAI